MSIAIHLTDVGWEVTPLPAMNGVPAGRMLHFADKQSGIHVFIPLTGEVAEQFRSALGGIQIAHQVPPQ